MKKVAFGLGYDELTDSLWFSHSFGEDGKDWLRNISLDGALLKSIEIDHQYGSVETMLLDKSENENTTLSEILLVVSPNQFNGSLADVMIWADENRSEKVLDETVSIFMDGQVLSYFLEPGDYELNIMGNGFTSYKHFTLLPGENYAVEVELLDAYTVDWVIDYRDDTPTTGSVSPETHLLWFEVSQNWLKYLYLYGFTFYVENPDNAVTIESCKLQFYTLAGWNDMSLPVDSCADANCNYQFTVDNGAIDPYWYVHPNSPWAHLFALSCDVTAAQPGASVKTYNSGFGFKNSYLLPFSLTVSPEKPEVTF